MSTTQPVLSVVVPCFNEQDVIRATHERLWQALAGHGKTFEIVYVNDGSSDATAGILDGFAAAASGGEVRVVHFSRNFGHQAALSAGLDHVRGRAVGIIDADLQDPPEVLMQMFTRWGEGFDVVYGVRRKRKEGLLKRASYSGFYWLLSRLSEIQIPLDSGDFCVMDESVVECLRGMEEPNPFWRGLRAWVGFRQCAFEYERHARAAGEPKYTFSKLVGLAVDGLLSFSSRPLRLATYLGLMTSGLAMLSAIYRLAQGLFPDFFARHGYQPVPGFATTVILILVLGGVQLVCIGILGEYLGRIHAAVKHRPRYVVRVPRRDEVR